MSRYQTGGEGADYVMVRYQPDLDWSKVKQGKGEVVVVVDTSAGGDEANRQLRVSTAEAILRALSEEDRFALVALDVKPVVVHPAEGLATATEGEIAKALEKLAGHPSGGATDLASSFEVSLGRVHGGEQPAVVYVGDGLATSGEMTGEQLVERLRRALTSSRARLFTVAVGAEADTALLGELARAGGGQSFRVDEPSEVTSEALELAAAVKVPTITDFVMDLGAGLDEPFVSTSGKVSRGPGGGGAGPDAQRPAEEGDGQGAARRGEDPEGVRARGGQERGGRVRAAAVGGGVRASAAWGRRRARTRSAGGSWLWGSSTG